MLHLEVRGRTLLIFAGLLVAFWILFRLWPIVVLISTAFIFMAALLPYVAWLERRLRRRILAVLVVLLVIAVSIGGVFFLVVPGLVDEFSNVHDRLPEYGQRADELLANFNIDVDLEGRAHDVDWASLANGQVAVQYGQQAFVLLISLVTVLVLTAYLLSDTPRLSAFLYQFVAPGHEPSVQQFLERLRRAVGGYVRGQFITSACISIFTTAVMLALGLPNAIAFGLLAGFADIIPLVGAFLAIGPPVVVALSESSGKALVVLIALVAYQQFEDRFLAPRVYGSTLNLPPLIVLIAVLVGGELFGISGVLLALPAAAVARVLIDYYLERRHLARQVPGPAGDIFAPDQPSQGTVEVQHG